MDKYPEPMLAAKPKNPNKKGVNEFTLIKFPKLGSPKFDGIRCEVKGGQVWSRKGLVIPNKRVQRLFGRRGYEGFDGELIVGDPLDNPNECFNRTQSGVMTIEGEPDVYLYAFDFLRGNVKGYAYEARYKELQAHYNELKDQYIRVVHQQPIADEMELQMYEEAAVRDGYEGCMLRDPSGGHKHGRSTMKEQGLIAVKRFVDAEAIILESHEQMTNTNEATINELGRSKRSSAKAGKVGAGILGAWTVRITQCGDVPEFIGREFEVGTGMSKDQRLVWWRQRAGMQGQHIKMKFQAHGSKDKPRIPVFQCLYDPRS